MRGLFYIEAPFQLLSAYEAIKAYNLKFFYIFVRLSQGNNEQLRNVVKALFEDEQNITYFYIENKNRNIKDYLTALKYYTNHFFQKLSYDYIFIGNYESKFLSVIIKMTNKKKIILLDDGVKNLYIQKGFTDENYYNIFTMLNTLKPLDKQNIRYHCFENIKNIFSKKIKSCSCERSKIIFLGSKISEVDIITKHEYLMHIENLLKSNSEKTILYLPHRGENLEKLAVIKKNYENLDIKITTLPVELYLLANFEVNQVKYILSFYSAALVSLKFIYDNLEAYYLPFNYQDSIHKEGIDQVYENMYHYGVKNFYECKHV